MSAIAKLPKFETLDEIVAFWDTHDFTNYLDEMEEVDLEIGLPGHTPESLHVPLDEVLMRRLREIAAERGLSSGELARLWLEDRLLRETGRKG